MNRGLEQLLQDYLLAPDPIKLLNLRMRIRHPLAERLAIISIDRIAVRQAIEQTISRFAATAEPATGVNWLIWITAHAMSILVESTGRSCWIDGLVRNPSTGSALEFRAMMFGAILSLGGTCQWLLLANIWSIRQVVEPELRECMQNMDRVFRMAL